LFISSNLLDAELHLSDQTSLGCLGSMTIVTTVTFCSRFHCCVDYVTELANEACTKVTELILIITPK